MTQAANLIAAFREQGLSVATAESCTGGMIAGVLTEIPGSSDVVDRGFVTYSNAAKQTMLGVQTGMIEVHGAVSEPVARAMAEGALTRSEADIAVAVTGIAGPGGGTATKPVGLVHFGCAMRWAPTRSEHHVFPGDRTMVRLATILAAFRLMQKCSAP